jgi:hypothetical protein
VTIRASTNDIASGMWEAPDDIEQSESVIEYVSAVAAPSMAPDKLHVR